MLNNKIAPKNLAVGDFLSDGTQLTVFFRQ